MSESMDGSVYSSGKVSRMHETPTDHLREAWEVASQFLESDRDVIRETRNLTFYYSFLTDFNNFGISRFPTMQEHLDIEKLFMFTFLFEICNNNWSATNLLFKSLSF